MPKCPNKKCGNTDWQQFEQECCGSEYMKCLKCGKRAKKDKF